LGEGEPYQCGAVAIVTADTYVADSNTLDNT
jgi:hypothetical protein